MTTTDFGKDYYAVLGVPSSADVEALKTAFRALVKRYHPDVATVARSGDEGRFQEVNEAYRVLSDPQSRRAYDMQRRAAEAGQRTRELNLDATVPANEFSDTEVDALVDAAKHDPD